MYTARSGVSAVQLCSCGVICSILFSSETKLTWSWTFHVDVSENLFSTFSLLCIF